MLLVPCVMPPRRLLPSGTQTPCSDQWTQSRSEFTVVSRGAFTSDFKSCKQITRKVRLQCTLAAAARSSNTLQMFKEVWT